MSEKVILSENFTPINPNLTVENFNPAEYLKEYKNTSGDVVLRLPFNALLMWFWRIYPEGKIAVETRPGNNVVIAKAKVYANRTDALDAYIAEGESSRGPSPDMPSVNPRNWAQTAAIATALRYAGFGAYEVDIVGDEPESITGEFDSLLDGNTKPVAPKAANKVINDIVDGETVEETPVPNDEPDFDAMTNDEAVAAAGNVKVPRGKYEGKTMNEVILQNPGYPSYVLKNFDHDSLVYKAAKVLVDAAARMAE